MITRPKIVTTAGVVALLGVVSGFTWRIVASHPQTQVNTPAAAHSRDVPREPAARVQESLVRREIPRGVMPPRVVPPPAQSAVAAAAASAAAFTTRPLLGGTTRKAIVEEIMESGPDESPWTQDAGLVIAEIQRELPSDLSNQVQFKEATCFDKACIADVVYANAAAYERCSPLFWSNPKLTGWPGIKGRTPVDTLESGKLVVSWLLYNPES
jgi:hypothetical protein